MLYLDKGVLFFSSLLHNFLNSCVGFSSVEGSQEKRIIPMSQYFVYD